MAIRTMYVRCTELRGLSGTTFRAMNESNGRPNGSTQAANSRFPTIRSRSFDVAWPARKRARSRLEYLITFAGSRLHTFVREQ